MQSDIPSLQAISRPCFPNFQLSIPDQYRVDQWLPTFQQDEKSGKMPQPDVHVADDRPHDGHQTSLIRSRRSPTTIWPSGASSTRSRTASSGRARRSSSIEDDTQNGVDHVDGHRGPTFVISPYSAPGVDDQYYTQLNMVKTIEQILGIKPMNQED